MTSTGFIGLLNLKKEAVVALDGQSILLKTDDFVGISGVDDGFHLTTVRSQPNATVLVGFIMTSAKPSLVRKYDPQTEEVSSKPLDALTTNNLLERVESQSLPPTNVLEYSKIVSQVQTQTWRRQTSFINSSGILHRRGISHGDKIIPGAYRDESDLFTSTDSAPSRPTIEDGKSLDYPSIPVVDATLSLRSNRHIGTKSYLAMLSPTERTQLFVEPQISTRLLRDVLSSYYFGRWESLLGDLQLAYTLFLYLQCLASLEHWRDLVAMLSLVEPSGMKDYPSLYQEFLRVLPAQISTMDKGFLEDIDEAGNNFLLPSLKQLCHNLTESNILQDEDMFLFQRLLSNKFPTIMVVDENDIGGSSAGHFMVVDSDDDSDAPVMVDSGDIDASLARSANVSVHASSCDLPGAVMAQYPLLVAAIQPHEDILMSCARALDEKQDVSLVREAAAYLEQIEQHR